MAPYEPTSRRPIADLFRKTAHWSVELCIKFGIHPDTVSYLSVVASLAAAICFWRSGAMPWLLIPAALFCYVRLWFNMLDGMVALASGKASLRGEVLNELPDRISDVIIFVGVAHSGLCTPLGAYWVAIFSLFVAYVGMFGQAVGGEREFGGVMAKPWRMVVLHLGAWLTLGLLVWNDGDHRLGGWAVLDWTHLAIIVGALQTIIVRLRGIFSSLKSRQRAELPDA
jgi:phosphatidylglycerophosphate synthase